MNPIVVKEHDIIDSQSFPILELKEKEKYLFPLRNGKNEYDGHNFFEYNIRDKCFYASFNIGAQHILNTDLVITPKFENIDFLKMYDQCIKSGIEADSFSKIYNIDLSSSRIKTDAFSSNVLSPLIIVHYLSVLKNITSKGLKKGYISKEENIHKLKGRLEILSNDRKNVQIKRFDKFYCNYQEYSENIPENKILKRALLFSKQVLLKTEGHAACTELLNQLKQNLSFFSNVDEDIQTWAIKNIKINKLYKDYAEAIRLAKLILQRYDFNITNIEIENDKQLFPPFWIDMSLLYEHYVLGILKEKYGEQIKYQVSGHSGIADFICLQDKLILDTKYKDSELKSFEWDNIQQLSGYGRDEKIRNLLKVEENECIKCVLIYPEKDKMDEENEKSFSSIPEFNLKTSLTEIIHNADMQTKSPAKSRFYKDFYRICVELPYKEQ